MTRSSQGIEPPPDPGRFRDRLGDLAGMGLRIDVLKVQAVALRPPTSCPSTPSSTRTSVVPYEECPRGKCRRQEADCRGRGTKLSPRPSRYFAHDPGRSPHCQLWVESADHPAQARSGRVIRCAESMAERIWWCAWPIYVRVTGRVRRSGGDG